MNTSESATGPIHFGLAPVLALLLSACGSGGGETGDSNNIGFGNGSNNPVALSEIDLDFTVENLSSTDRHETISASVPFPEGAVNNLGQLALADHQTTWMPLQSWADGSIRVAQVQFTDTVPANSKKTYRVLQGQTAHASAFTPHSYVAQRWSQTQLGAQVKDRFGHHYEALISGDGEVLQETALKRVRRWRVYHESLNGGGIGRDYLTSTFYVTDFRDTPFLIVDWVFGNDYMGSDNPGSSTDPNLFPLGPVDVDDVGMLSRGFAAMVPYHADWNEVRSPFTDGSGRNVHIVMDNDWIADGQTRRYRFLARLEAGGGNQQEWRDAFVAFKEGPMNALAALRAWQQTRSLGLVGGPIDGPSDAASRAARDFNQWAGLNVFGTWGSFGDVKASGATGTPRNVPLTEPLAHAAQSGELRLLTQLEQMCWAQAQRAYHMYGLTVSAEPDVQFVGGIPLSLGNQWARDLAPESLGRRSLRSSDPWSSYRSRAGTDGSPHGWTHFDRSHWTTDLLFDHWTVTGDAWAQEELRLNGQILRGIHHWHTEPTNQVNDIRAEGWAMHSFVQCYLATGDEGVKSKAVRRTREIIEVLRLKDHPSKALRSHSNSGSSTVPASSFTWYSPWQNYSVFLGYFAAARFFDEPLFMTIAEDSISSIRYAWVEDYQDPVDPTRFVDFGYRYFTFLEVDGSPVSADVFDRHSSYSVPFAEGTQGRMPISGMLHIAQWTRNQSVADDARYMARKLVPRLNDYLRWNKWTYCVPASEFDEE